MDGISIGQFFIAALLVLLVPGGALLAWLPKDQAPRRRSLFSLLADAVALSIAVQSLVALGLFLAGVRVSGGVVAGLYGLCLLLALAGVIKRRAFSFGAVKNIGWWASGLLSVLFLAGLVAWRLYQARPLALPNWVDSVQHFLIIRIILEHGGLPSDLTPYLPVSFSYHYGFHLIAALFISLSGLSSAQVALAFGQVLNALVAVSVYRAAEVITGPLAEADSEPPRPDFGARLPRLAASMIAPYLAALLVGFDFQMPAYYLTWGRYTLLTGLLLLGPTLAAALEVRDQPRRLSGWVRLVLLVAAQGVTHYFILLLTALFLLIIALPGILKGVRDPRCWLPPARLAVLALLGVLLVSPWLLQTWRDFSAEARVTVTNPLEQSEAARKSTADYAQYLWYLIGPRRNYILMGMAAVGALFALLRLVGARAAAVWERRRDQRLAALISWALVIGLLSLPLAPRLGPFRPDHYSIVLFFPAAVLLADMLASGAEALSRRIRPVVGWIVLALISALFLVWGLRDAQDMVNADTILAMPADVQALDWIKEHTPPDARFYNNSVIWQGQVYRGADGAAWLMPYTGRYSLVPPIMYNWGAQDYAQQINDWAARSSKFNGCTDDFWSLIREAGLTHVYVRQGQGALQPEMLSSCPGLRLVYMQQGVYIFEILSPQ